LLQEVVPSKAAVATAPMNNQIVFARSRARMSAGWKTKLSLMVATIRYTSDSRVKTATKRSKLIIAGPLPVEATILATRTMARKAVTNWKPRRPRLSARETILEIEEEYLR